MSDIERVIALAFALCVACGGARSTERQSSATAAQHRQAAAEEERAAEEHEEQYARSRAAEEDRVANSELWFGVEVYDPSEFHWREAREARHRAAQHRAAAQELEAYEARECGHFPAETRTHCPLVGQIESVRDIRNGVALELVEGANIDAIADHMRCHIAFASARGRNGMDHCPLYVEGAEVSANGEIRLTTDAGDDAVEAIRERMHWLAEEGE